MLSLCCDGRDTIEGRRADSVKDLRPRFTRTDIHAGQGHLSVPLTSLRCRRWQRSQASGPHLRVAPTGSGLTTSWSLVIDSTCQVCATRPLPIHPAASWTAATPQPAAPAHRLQGRCHTPGRPHLHAEPSSSPSTFRPAANADGDIPRGQVRLAPARGIRRRRGQQSRPPTRETSPAGRKSPRTRRMSPHASELSETRRTLVVLNAARLPLSRWHRRPRMATDSTTTADTTFVRAALRTIVTIGDS